MLPSFDCLSRTREARWIGFDGYKYTGIKLNFWFIDKVQWIVLVETLLLLNSTVFRYS